MLNASVVDQDIYSSKLLQSLIHDVFAICRFGQIGKDVDRHCVGVFGFKLLHSLFDFLLRGKAVENDVISLGCQGVSDSQADSTERASYECDFVVAPAWRNSYLEMSAFSKFANLSIDIDPIMTSSSYPQD